LKYGTAAEIVVAAGRAVMPNKPATADPPITVGAARTAITVAARRRARRTPVTLASMRLARLGLLMALVIFDCTAVAVAVGVRILTRRTTPVAVPQVTTLHDVTFSSTSLRMPQSVQSVPMVQDEYSVPGPPSSQSPSEAHSHVSVQAVTFTLAVVAIAVAISPRTLSVNAATSPASRSVNVMMRSVEYTGAVSGVDAKSVRTSSARAAPAGEGTTEPLELLKVDSGKVSRRLIVLTSTVDRTNPGLVAVSSRDTWQRTGWVVQLATLPTIRMNSTTSS
jgi:hypothetical protein